MSHNYSYINTTAIIAVAISVIMAVLLSLINFHMAGMLSIFINLFFFYDFAKLYVSLYNKFAISHNRSLILSYVNSSYMLLQFISYEGCEFVFEV